MSISFCSAAYYSMGNARVVTGELVFASQTSGAVAVPGLTYIDRAFVTPGSLTSAAAIAVRINAASGGTATNGYLQVLSGTSDMNLQCMIFGKA